MSQNPKVLPLYVTECQREVKIHHQKEVVVGIVELCQLHAQATDLIEHVHQNLSMSHLNGHDMIQRTSNV